LESWYTLQIYNAGFKAQNTNTNCCSCHLSGSTSWSSKGSMGQGIEKRALIPKGAKGLGAWNTAA